MGNRAVVTFSTAPTAVAIYLHWGGSRENVERVLDQCRTRGVRGFSNDPAYCLARVIGAFHEANGIDSATGVGVGLYRDLDTDNGDNGVYVVNDRFQIVDRLFRPEGVA